MKTGLILQLVLFVILLAGSSEEFFLEYPKKALTEFFQSLKAKKQEKTPKMNSIQHYHVHYYPIPYSMLAWMRAPDKRDLEKLYDNSLASFGWSDYDYKYTSNPSIIVSSGLQELWDDPWNEEILGPDDVRSTIDRNAKGILLQVPVNQQFVFHMLKKSRQRSVSNAT